MIKSQRLITWFEVAAWMGLILYLSGEAFDSSRTWIALNYWVNFLKISISPPTLLAIHFVIRKAAHFTEFFVLGLLLSRAIQENSGEFQFKDARWVLGAGLLCALGDEAHQILFLSRTPSLWDSLLDFSGVLASQLYLLFRSHSSHAALVRAGPEETSATPEESP